MELTPNLYRVGDDLVASYLVVDAQGATLVDAGLPGDRRRLLEALASLGRTPRDLRGVVITHGDADHTGLAGWLQREFGTPIWIHEADAARALGTERAPRTAAPAWRLGAALRFLRAFLGRGFGRVRLREAHTFDSGQDLDLPGAPHIIGLPGHSPGSVAVVLPHHDAVCVGDALTTRHVLTGVTEPAPAPFTDDPEQAHASLERLRGVRARLVLPGHGPVWTDGLDPLLDALGVPGQGPAAASED